MTRIEAQIKYEDKFSGVYPRIEELGGRLHWFGDRDKLSGLKIDLTQYSGKDLDTVLFSMGRLMDYIRMPAIEDDFATDRKRHDWLEDKDEEIVNAYKWNRLKVNTITIARASIDFVNGVFKKNGDVRADVCQSILDRMWIDFGNEDREKISVQFADKLAEDSLRVLNLI